LKLSQQTRFPIEHQVECRMQADAPTRANIRVRIPSWASQEMEVFVNGRKIGTGRPGSYLPVDRQWSDQDVIAFTLPMEFRARRYTGSDQIDGATRYSLEYGPLVYAAVGNSGVSYDGDDLVKSLEPVRAKPLTYRLRSSPGVEFVPYLQLNQEEFTCFPSVINHHA